MCLVCCVLCVMCVLCVYTYNPLLPRPSRSPIEYHSVAVDKKKTRTRKASVACHCLNLPGRACQPAGAWKPYVCLGMRRAFARLSVTPSPFLSSQVSSRPKPQTPTPKPAAHPLLCLRGRASGVQARGRMSRGHLSFLQARGRM